MRWRSGVIGAGASDVLDGALAVSSVGTEVAFVAVSVVEASPDEVGRLDLRSAKAALLPRSSQMVTPLHRSPAYRLTPPLRGLSRSDFVH